MYNLDNTSTINEKSPDNKTVLIFGATGGFGAQLTRQMASKGWWVRAVARTLPEINTDKKQINWIVGDLEKPASVQDAAKGVDVIVHAVNVPYQHWNPTMVNYTRTIIDLARDNNAHLMFVGNVYNAGVPANGLITEHTPNAPINAKGEIRAQLEAMIEQASEDGIQTTIMRFGDFFGPSTSTSNWFNVCTKGIKKNKIMFADDADIPHTWAYLPDAVNAFEQVAAQRLHTHSLPRHIVLPFAGHVFSFAQLRNALELITAQPMKVTRMPWVMFKLLGTVVPFMRELVSMRYLWQHDIRMDDSALKAMLGSAPEHTNLQQAILTSVPDLVDVRHSQPDKQVASFSGPSSH